MENQKDLLSQAQSGDKEARNTLVEMNLGLVHHIVKRFYGRGQDCEDLFQIGSIGLMKAIDHFDLSREVCFSTYAVPMIMGEIKRFLRDDGMVKVSRTLKENGWKVRRAATDLEQKNGREPTVDELSMITGLTPAEIAEATEANAEVESIHRSVYQNDGSEIFLLDQVVAGEKVGSLNHKTAENEEWLNRILVEELLDKLDKDERKLITLRYLCDKTQVEVAGIFGISQVQVSRMEKKILLRLRSTFLCS